MSLIKKITQIPVDGIPVTSYYFLGIPVRKDITVLESRSTDYRVSELEGIVDKRSLDIANMDIRIINLENQVRELESAVKERASKHQRVEIDNPSMQSITVK